MSGQVYPLQGSVQHYAWGRVGPDSTVAQLYESSTKNTIKSSEPYAEVDSSGKSSVLLQLYRSNISCFQSRPNLRSQQSRKENFRDGTNFKVNSEHC